MKLGYGGPKYLGQVGGGKFTNAIWLQDKKTKALTFFFLENQSSWFASRSLHTFEYAFSVVSCS
jgi:hypothetical protein